ncbi:hypothetical protein [Akkermansia sp.]|uniref:hypothetical protein n=1 Tax=Akkermansia sp. TaxID=1872421 RepID=UPI00266BF0AC|nr:hypothetical protein [uncultured Akkermansia sp.]
MAIKLIANYSKRLGLPGYSSHQFEVSIETEIGNTSELDFAAERLYSSLQSAVDAQIRQVGFVPDASYGSGGVSRTSLPAMRQIPRISMQTSGDKRSVPVCSDQQAWNCSEKQKQVILSLTRKNGMNDSALHDLAVLCFSKGVSQLNKLEASTLIKELIGTSGATSRKASSSGNYT